MPLLLPFLPLITSSSQHDRIKFLPLPFKNQQSSFINRQSNLLVAEEPLAYGRSPAFRRKILGIYDHQCAACGLRIKLPAGNDVSFIDAAHLIPFSEIQNDHPTNGLALCKNHH